MAKDRIDWSSGKPTLIQENGNYGRMARLNRRTIIVGFDVGGVIHVRLSNDEGKSWDEPIRVAEMDGGVCTNTEFCVLDDRQVLCFFNFRPSKGSGKAFSIGMSKSSNRGRSWSSPTILYSAGTKFEEGCWEPACVRLPGGELQVFFANEGPYRESTEQEISMLRSRDDAKSWSDMETISFRANSRDGMPVPAISIDAKSLFVAIEDNGLSGAFKPVILATHLSNNGWREGVIDGESRSRWSAMNNPLPAKTYAGAPYLTQLPDGPFVLSFQMAESGEMNDSRMAVSLGNDKAKRFAEPSFPFTSDSGKAQLWNSLFIKNENTVTAVSQTTIGGKRGIWAIDGKIVD